MPPTDPDPADPGADPRRHADGASPPDGGATPEHGESGAGPRIGVVLPVYRVEAYVADCIDSLAAQTLRPDRVVVVDDCGGDASVDIAVASLARHGLAYEVVRQPENRGLGRARNDGLARLDTPLVWFLDSDDTVEPEFLESMSRALADTGAAMVTCRTRRVIEGDQGTGYRSDSIDEGPYPAATCTGSEFARGLLGRWFTAYAPTKLFRREALPGRPWDEGRAYEDFAPMVRFGLAHERIALVNAPLYRYRWRASSISARFGPRTTDLFGVADSVAAALAAAGVARAWRTEWVGYRYREVLLPIAHLAMRSSAEPWPGPGPSPATALREVRRRISLRDLPRLIAGRRPRTIAFAVMVKLTPAVYRWVLLRR